MDFIDIKKRSGFKLITAAGNLLIVQLSIPLSNLLTHSALGSLFSFKAVLLFLGMNVAWMLCSWLSGLYNTNTFGEIEKVYIATIKSVVLYVTILYAGVLFVSFSMQKFLFIYSLIISVLFIASMFHLTYLSEYVFTLPKFKKKIAVIGYNERGLTLADYFNKDAKKYSFSGFFDNYSDYTVNQKGDIIGPISDCINYAVENNISEIYSTIAPARLKTVLKEAEKNCVRILFIKDEHTRIFSFMPGVKNSSDIYYPVAFIHDYLVVQLRREPLEYTSKRIIKRITDIVISVLAIILILSWLIPFIAILIKLDSKGPVFFVQKRAGRNNKNFDILKFRTMITDNNQNYKQAVKNDPRVTRVGKYLRKLSIDEMPQFLNVFIGNMSFIGPRPHPLKLNDEYMDTIQSYMARHFVKPGITGWAQANGYRGETETMEIMTRRIEYDLWYIENWSLMLDIRIMLLTIINFFKGDKNAY